MTRTLLLEIGTEEIPAHAMPGILGQLKDAATKTLGELRLAHGEVRTLGTPRRIALLVDALDERQPDSSEEKRGPSLKVAFDADGNATKATQGFARGQRVDVNDLVKKDGYVYAVVKQQGKATGELLATLLPGLITGLTFPNQMRWGSLEFKFIRPLRWIVALYGADVVPFSVANVESGRTSRGHRFHGKEFALDAADGYVDACEKQFVIVDQERRRRMIREQIDAVAKENGGRAEIDENLLEEVVYLVEYPTALCGHFEDKYLKLPPEAVITPMRDHQRYFPVKDAGGALLPLFIAVRNGGKDFLETVQHGNERVLRARLADARFFFDEDRKAPLEAHLPKLRTVVFQEGLGTLFDKTQRLGKLAETIADLLKVSAEDKAAAMRAATLSKCDLVTGMVTEFTELQGVMGREYAKLDGEPLAVATAIDEHYRPRFAGDKLPATAAGRIVSLADKIDNLVATFSRGLVPTGSADPFALRRQALGLVRALIDADWHLSLEALVSAALDQLAINDAEARAKMQADVAEFLRVRLKGVLDDAGIRYDVADAVLGSVDDLTATYYKALALTRKLMDGDLAATVQALVRVGNITRGAEPCKLRPADFAEDVERGLLAAYRDVAGKVAARLADGNYPGTIDALADLAAPVNAFFDAVMVMDKDEAVRTNRLALLQAIDALAKQFADFGALRG